MQQSGCQWCPMVSPQSDSSCKPLKSDAHRCRAGASLKRMWGDVDDNVFTTSWTSNWCRYFETEPWQDVPQKWWFGGGTDITPSYVDAEDMKHFHGVYKVSWLRACARCKSPDP